MYTARIMSSKRKGMASILGTLIFIGILFSAIVPMTIMMKQADLFYTQELHNAEAIDADKADESIVVTSYPESLTDKMKIKVYNKGIVPVTIKRVWINNDTHTENYQLSPTDSKTFDPYSVDLSEENYNVKVVTGRGNVFYSVSGTLYYSDGTWIAPSLGICVNVINDQGKYKIHVESITSIPEKEYDGWYNLEGNKIDFGDIIQTFLLNEEVDYEGVQFRITITKKVGGGWVNLPYTPIIITMDWPNGSPIKYMFANGMGV